MKFDILDQLPIPGAYLFRAFDAFDARGRFTKFYSSGVLLDAFEPREVFVNRSAQGVVRGMHLQSGPAQSGKMVACLNGRVHDALVDTRVGSPMRGRHVALQLDAGVPVALYIPPGVAHGFQALEADCAVLYLTGAVHAPAHDDSIHPFSCAIDWPIAQAIVSERDARAPRLDDYLAARGAVA